MDALNLPGDIPRVPMSKCPESGAVDGEDSPCRDGGTSRGYPKGSSSLIIDSFAMHGAPLLLSTANNSVGKPGRWDEN